MTAFFVALALVFFLTGGDAQQPPNLPNSFRANVTVEYEGGKAAGTIAVDHTAGKSRETMFVCDDASTTNLMRADLGKAYFSHIVGPTDGCFGLNITKGTLPINWDWVAAAKHTESLIVRGGVQVDVWSYATPNKTDSYLEIAVLSSNPSQPYFMRVRDDDSAVTVFFDKFSTTALPDASYYNLPTTCSKIMKEEQILKVSEKSYFPFFHLFST